MLNVLTSPGLSYYSDIALASKGSELATRHISIMEYVVIAVIRFLATVWNGAAGVASVDSQMGGIAWDFVALLASGC